MPNSRSPMRLGMICAASLGSAAWTTAFQFAAIVTAESRVLSDPVWLVTGFSFLFAITVVAAGMGGVIALWLARGSAIVHRPRRSHGFPSRQYRVHGATP